MPLMTFLLQYTHQGRGYFRYVLTVVCEYHLRFLGPYSIMTYSSTFIYQGVLNWFYLFWFNYYCLLRIFYSSIQQRSPGEKSRQGLWGRSPPEVLNLGHVKTKGIIWCYWWRFYCSAHQHCVFSMWCCTMFCILGSIDPLPLKPPLILSLSSNRKFTRTGRGWLWSRYSFLRFWDRS